MPEDDGIQILKLSVLRDMLDWEVLRGRLDGSELPDERGQVTIEVDDRKRETIEVLDRVVQLSRRGEFEDEAAEEGARSETLQRLVQVIGGQLYDVLFRGEVHQKLHRMLQREGHIRIQLSFDEGGEYSFMASWPWEFLYVPQLPGLSTGGQFLGRAAQIHRKIDVRSSMGELETSGRVKVLVVVVSPDKLDPVDTAFHERLPNVFQVKVVKDARKVEQGASPLLTRDGLAHLIHDQDPHVVHFVGHGRWDPEDAGALALVKAGWEADWVSGSEFVRSVMSGKNLRMVFLQACDVGRQNPRLGAVGAAQRLAKRIPAVVGMQARVEQGVADAFARCFYLKLAAGMPVDVAVRDGCNELWRRAPTSLGIPILYLRQFGAMVPQRRVNGAGAAERSMTGRARSDCPNCRAKVGSANFCGNCGMQLLCLDCSAAVLDARQNFCQGCRAKIEPPPPSPAVSSSRDAPGAGRYS